MRRSRWIAVPVAVLFAATTFAARVQVNHDPNASFDSYRTFSWTKGSDAQREDVQAMIVAAVERELMAKGLTRAAEGVEGDLLVATHAAATSALAVSSDYLQSGYGWGIIRADVTKLTDGMLIVDLVDNQRDEMVWHGVVTDAVSQDIRKAEKKIDQLTKKLFKQYPPKK